MHDNYEQLPSGVLIPQSAKVFANNASVATRASSHPADYLTPTRLAEIMRDAESGVLSDISDLYCDMEIRDGHLFSEMSKRRGRVTELDWSIEPPEGADAKALAATAQLDRLVKSIPNMDALLFNLTDAIGKGLSANEIQWHRQNGYWLPKAVHARPLSMFRVRKAYTQPAMTWADELRFNDGTADGVALASFGWIVHRHDARTADLTQSALYMACAWPFLFRVFSIGDWLEFLEVYGYPIRIGTYRLGATPEERRSLMRAVVDIGRRAGGIVPEGSKIDLIAATSGDPEAFSRLIEWCDRTQSKLVNAGTLTSQADGKSSTNALGNVHERGGQSLTKGDAKRLANTLSRDLLWPMAALNGLATGPSNASVWVFDTGQAEDLAAYADGLPKLAAAGVQIPVKWVSEKLRIPLPQPGEAVLSAPQNSSPPQNAFSALSPPGARHPGMVGRVPSLMAFNESLMTPSNALRAGEITDLSVEALIEPISAGAEATLKSWVDRLRTMGDAADSMETLRDNYLNAFGHLDTKDLVVLMEYGFALSALKGLADVVAESKS